MKIAAIFRVITIPSVTRNRDRNGCADVIV